MAPYCLQDKVQTPLTAVKVLPDLVPACLSCPSPSSCSHVPNDCSHGNSCCLSRLPIASHLRASGPHRSLSPRILPSPSLRVYQDFQQMTPPLPKADCHPTIRHDWLTLISAPHPGQPSSLLEGTSQRQDPVPPAFSSLTPVTGLSADRMVWHVAEAQPIVGD